MKNVTVTMSEALLERARVAAARDARACRASSPRPSRSASAGR